MYLTSQGLLVKRKKKDSLVFNTAYLASPSFIFIHNITSLEDEIDLKYGYTFKNHLKRIYNLRINYSNKEILLFDDDTSGAFRHIKLHLDVAGAHAFIIRNKLYIPLGSIFGLNVSSYNWEVIVLSRIKLAEWLQL